MEMGRWIGGWKALEPKRNSRADFGSEVEGNSN